MKILYYSLFIVSSVVFMANRSGRAAVSGNGATTAPGESGTYCGSIGCHFNGSFNPEATIRLLDRDSMPVESYSPSEKYIIELSATHTGNPAGYGFQFVALRSVDNAGIGGYEDFPNRVRAINIGDRVYVEHSNILSTNPIYLDWEAPSDGTGDVDFYAAINVVNGNGSSSGDGADTTRIKIVEDQLSSVVSNAIESSISVWPNPASEFVHIQSRIGYSSVSVHDSSGKKLLERKGTDKLEIELNELGAGLYVLLFNLPEGKVYSRKILVQK